MIKFFRQIRHKLMETQFPWRLVFCFLTQNLFKGNQRKPKKSDLEDLQKAHAQMTRALFEQSKIILPDSY